MDIRTINHKWWDSIDRKGMTAVVSLFSGDVTVRIKYEVCSVCNGKGHHVNPSIDMNGISPEQFAGDPDFAESYFAGDYDVICNGCDGDRVQPVCNDAKVNLELAEMVEASAEIDAQHAAERAFGA